MEVDRRSLGWPALAFNRGMAACSMYATGGFTHFIEGLEPASLSKRRCANLAPAGRAAQ